MKSLVIYSSQSGNTRKLAEAACQGLGDTCDLFPVDQAPDPAGYDLVAVGFWLQAGRPDPKSQAFLDQLKENGGRVFLFATHGAAAASDHARQAMDHAVAAVSPTPVIGTFNCQGAVNPKVLEKVRAKNPPPPWIDHAATAVGHPDTGDLDRLRETLTSCLAGL